jgi:hypothetical protein
MTATDSFNPTDAEGLAAWFARAEDNATRLRRRLATLGGEWQTPAPEPVWQEPKSDPGARRTTQTRNLAQAAVGTGKRSRRRGQDRRPRHG